jgi:hypothetical protein
MVLDMVLDVVGKDVVAEVVEDVVEDVDRLVAEADYNSQALSHYNELTRQFTKGKEFFVEG